MVLEKSMTIEVKLHPYELKSVNTLEEVSKVGFACQAMESETLLHPLVRLVVENDTENDPTPATPFMPVEELDFLLNGALFLQPFLVKVIKERQADKPAPSEGDTTQVPVDKINENE